MAEHNRQSSLNSPDLGDGQGTMLITLIDQAGTITNASASYQGLLGYDPSSLPGRLLADLIHPDDLRDAKLCLALTESANAGKQVGRVRFRHAEGCWVWMEVSGPLVMDQGVSIRIFVASAIDANSKGAAQLHALEQLESIQYLTRRVTHDINNLLTGISGFANLAFQTLPERHAGRFDLEQIRKATTRAATLIQLLRMITREASLVPQVVELNDLLRAITPFLSGLIGTEIELIVQLAPELELIQADPTEIEQAIIGLMIHVSGLVSSGGRIVLRTANVVLPAALAYTSVQRHQGGYIMFTVNAISAVAMDAHLRRQELDRMYTRIIEQHGGLIRISHTTAWETSITLYLPRIRIPERTS